jgi:outer membrane lipoprotein-sorting protein
MRFIRTASTRRLLAALAAAAVLAGGGAAIAIAAGAGGPVPASKPLASAVHDALTGPPARGVTARIKFTNSLVDSAGLEGGAPLLKGGSGRLWLSDGRVRLELQSEQGDSQLVSDGKTFWAYDSSSRTVYRGTVPPERKPDGARRERNGSPSLKEIEQGIDRLARHADVSGAQPVDVAGQPAYSVRVAPHEGGLVGAGQLAFDAARGVPLRLGVYARGASSPVLQLEATDIAYGPVPAAAFAVSPPAGAKVVDLSTGRADKAGAKERRRGREVRGRAAVTKALSFKLAAPSELAGKRFEDVHLADWKGSPGAVVTYGRGLGGVAVIERKADPAESSARHSGENGRDSLTLPRVHVNGVSAEELATPLGTMIRFERAGVSYVVVGSVTRATAETAARSLAP